MDPQGRDAAQASRRALLESLRADGGADVSDRRHALFAEVVGRDSIPTGTASGATARPATGVAAGMVPVAYHQFFVGDVEQEPQSAAEFGLVVTSDNGLEVDVARNRRVASIGTGVAAGFVTVHLVTGDLVTISRGPQADPSDESVSELAGHIRRNHGGTWVGPLAFELTCSSGHFAVTGFGDDASGDLAEAADSGWPHQPGTLHVTLWASSRGSDDDRDADGSEHILIAVEHDPGAR